MSKTPKTPKMKKAALPETLDALAAVVLGALPGANDAQRDGLSAGEHPVDMTVTIHVKGELRIGAATSTTQINKLKPWHLARLLANRVPADVLAECINSAIVAATSELGADVMEAESDDLKTRVEAAFEQAGLAVKQPKRGNVSLYGQVDIRVKE